MSLLCPIDFRYGRPQMKRIFEEEARLQRLLDVEAALARAESKVGLVPREAAAEITKKATTKLVTVKRVEELERETRHDLMAVVLALTEACAGDAGNYVHLGATSNDIQTSVMTDLGIGFEEAATQVVGRDRHAEFIGILANLAASLEKFCTEVRNLQRTEIGEVAEAFESRSQVGSSTMAQKENPVAS